MVAEHLSVEEVAGIKEAFEMMDIGKRGKISIDELRNGLKKLGHQIPDADLQILMESVSIILPIHYCCDLDNFGFVTSAIGNIFMILKDYRYFAEFSNP